MNLKISTLPVMLALLLGLVPIEGAIYTEVFDGASTAIPVGNPAGMTFSGVVSDIPGQSLVLELRVQLNLSGGYNGGLYGYLVAPNGTMVVLMDQPGVAVNGMGAWGAGMNIMLQDGAAANGSIQNEISGEVLSGSYNAQGSLATFNGSAANGNWTLFFADMAGGGGSSELKRWSLEVTAVPEPVSTALIIFGGGAAVFTLGRWYLNRRSRFPDQEAGREPAISGTGTATS